MAAGTAIGATLLSSAASSAANPVVPAVEVMPGLEIFPRDAWGWDLPPKRATALETPKVLLVHHTASSNSYSNPITVLRNTYAWQTSPSKGWRDVCYNFFIGRNGEVWEGRAGSLTRPTVADATGGNQGFSQLVCLLGDFTSTTPTTAARASLAKVLAWLGPRSSIDLHPDATATFVSRGSQRWAAGVTVTAPTVAAHRDMSYTACPGDRFFPLMDDVRQQAYDQQQLWAGVLRPAVRIGQRTG